MIQQPMRLLVVGGSGFIGRHVVSHGVALEWDVTSLSLHPNNTPTDNVHYVVADISDSQLLKTVLKGYSFEYVVNCGGYIDHTLYSDGGRDVFKQHFEGVLNLTEVLDRQILKAFINIGSSDEYGSAPAPQVELQRESPISPYSLGKVAATHFLQMLHRTEKFPSVTLRLFLTYGPEQDNRRFLPQIITGCLGGKAFPTSAGQQLRDFCFVEDTVSAIFSALQNPRAIGEVINIGSGQPVSIREMIETVQRLIGRGMPQFGAVAYRMGENMELYADISKAKMLLGWKPKVSLEEGLGKTIHWVKNQL